MSLRNFLKLFLFFLTINLVELHKNFNINRLVNRLPSNGLIFYDLKTNQTLLPPIVTTENYSPFWRQAQIGLPCTCQQMTCGCCAGMSLPQLSNRFCTNFTYDPQEFAIVMDFIWNNNSIYQNSFSAKNPMPLCIPIPIPYIPIQMDMCIKLFNIFTPGSNLHMCMDFSARIQKAPVIVLHFDCMRMGVDGLVFLKPEENGGIVGQGGVNNAIIPVPPLPENEAENEQENGDVYDEVTEI